MLFEDVTNSAIVVGHQIELEENEVPLPLAKKLRDAVTLLNKRDKKRNKKRTRKNRRELGLCLYAPGDTIYGEDYACNLVIGRTVVMSDWSPKQFEASSVRQAVSDFPDLPDDYWHELGIELGVEITASAGAEAILMCWGPRCYGELCAGVPMTVDDEGEAKYEFITNVDYTQMPTEDGLDGVCVEVTHPEGFNHQLYVEYNAIWPVDFSEEAVQGYFEQVSKHDEPSLFLTCHG